AWVLVRRPDVPRGGAMLIGALLLAVTPVQPWYAVTLLAVATVAAAPAWSAVALAGYPYFFALLLDSPHTVAIGRASYGLALVMLVAGRRLYNPRSRSRESDEDRQGAGGRRTEERLMRQRAVGGAEHARHGQGQVHHPPIPYDG
ncbi:MAG: hypothetical protein M3163_13920, partial [Actinomycetota bacterium]|nr:hypothetical protein [Actinomycetota bacterium]